jgi:L-aminopeptidase/D-esterase-like protein
MPANNAAAERLARSGCQTSNECGSLVPASQLESCEAKTFALLLTFTDCSAGETILFVVSQLEIAGHHSNNARRTLMSH